jgi:hypothetical protein
MLSQFDVVNPVQLRDHGIGNAQHIFVVVNLRLLDAGNGNVGSGN